LASEVVIWWVALSTVGILNCGAWLVLFARSRRSQSAQSPLQKSELWLSGGYVAICAFRSFFPRADVQRICLFDSGLSSVLTGRTVATVAELCFVAQWALILGQLAKSKESAFADAVSRVVVPVIGIAEVFSWYAVLTTNYVGNVIEESIWALIGASLVVSLVILWFRSHGAVKRALSIAIVCSAFYVGFMSLVDVPMYYARWRADSVAARPYLSIADGFFDLAQRWIVTGSLSEWIEEMPWMALYFSVAVWISLALTRVPEAWLSQRKEPAR
jgi:hypothetical protein